MGRQYPVIEHADGAVTVLATSAEQAEAAAGDAIGPDFRTVSIERVRHGGLAGFFATELVRLTATPAADRCRPGAAGMATAEELVASLRLAAGGSFAERLSTELRHEGAAPPLVEPPPPAPAPGCPWSATGLRVLGVPDSVIDAALRHHPTDEIEWNAALLLALKPLCTLPPGDPAVMIGPACANLARHLKLVQLTAEELGDSVSSVAVPDVDVSELDRSARDRHIHLVIGGAWQHFVSVRPDIVSVAHPDGLIEAVRAAAAWGASLGWAVVDGDYVRIDPFMIIAHLRALLTTTPDTQ